MNRRVSPKSPLYIANNLIKTQNMKVKTSFYESPLVLVGAFKTEQGFAQSGNLTIQSFSYDTTEGEDLSF